MCCGKIFQGERAGNRRPELLGSVSKKEHLGDEVKAGQSPGLVLTGHSKYKSYLSF